MSYFGIIYFIFLLEVEKIPCHLVSPSCFLNLRRSFFAPAFSLVKRRISTACPLRFFPIVLISRFFGSTKEDEETNKQTKTNEKPETLPVSLQTAQSQAKDVLFLDSKSVLLITRLPISGSTELSVIKMFQEVSSVQFSRSVMSDSLLPYKSQHARPPCPSPTSGVHLDSFSL